MQAKTKIILIITGSVLIAGGLAVGLYFLLRKPDPEDEMQDIIDKGGSNSGGGTGNQTGNTDNSSDTGSTNNNSTGQVTPKFNAEGELTNSFSQLKGRILYPKRTATGGWGYTNVRTSAEVNTDQGWWDPSDNLITTINSGTQIGKVLSETTGLFNGYSYRWFKVKLTKPAGGFFSNYTEGFVRADTVIFQAYTP